AADRVAMALMEVPEWHVKHLRFASQHGLGPAALEQVTLLGDSLASRPFVRAPAAPRLEYPRVWPNAIDGSAGESAAILQWYGDRCLRKIEIWDVSDDSTAARVIRGLRPWALRGIGLETVFWDGRDDPGSPVPSGRYVVHVGALGLTG